MQCDWTSNQRLYVTKGSEKKKRTLFWPGIKKRLGVYFVGYYRTVVGCEGGRGMRISCVWTECLLSIIILDESEHGIWWLRW